VNLLHFLLVLLKNHQGVVIYVDDFLNFFAFLVISSKNFDVFV
jgi:hypothetical protein